jgi:hypothetical protein
MKTQTRTPMVELHITYHKRSYLSCQRLLL